MKKIEKITSITEARDLHKGVFSFLTSLVMVLIAIFIIIGGIAYISFSGGSGASGAASSVFADDTDDGTADSTGGAGTDGAKTPSEACQRLAEMVKTIAWRSPVWGTWVANGLLTPGELDEMVENFRVLCGDVV